MIIHLVVFLNIKFKVFDLDRAITCVMTV